MKTPTYELRTLISDDLFCVINIIDKIGFKEFKECFNASTFKAMANAEKEKTDVTAVGIDVAFNIASVVFRNASKAKDDINILLANLSGKTKKEIEQLPIAEYANMIVDVVQKEDFKDFFMVASRLIK